MAEPTSTVPERPARILLIQDEVPKRTQVAGALRSSGFEVVEVGSGLAAIESAPTCHPDLLLIDMHLPDLDAVEVTGKLRRLGLDGLPIVALGTPGAERKLALSAGCTGILPNPPDLVLLPGQLREFLGGKKDKLQARDEKKFLKELSGTLVEKLEAKVRELTSAAERMKRADEFKTEFMGAISHELSTPLTPLAGYLKILQSEKLGPLNERQKKVVDSMLQSAERLSRTIDNLADFAVLESGTFRARVEEVKLLPMAEHLVDEAQLTVAKPKRVHITLAKPAAELTLAGDRARLLQAVGNVVENAVRASPHGGEVLLEIALAGDRVVIATYDQGQGIPPPDQERIFEPFYQQKGVQQLAATGLGLPVARRIIEAHGGRLRVESPPKSQPESERPFSGAKFIIELPLAGPTP